jgi:endonuclease/exonuclease/phosphatase (EEP) superfamily protein YafD
VFNAATRGEIVMPDITGAEGQVDAESQRHPWVHRFTVALRRCTCLGLTMLAAALLFGWLAWLHPVFDLASHFQVQYLVAAVAALVVLLATRSWRWSILAVALVALTGARVLPWWLSTTPTETARAATAPNALRLLHANVLRRNTQYNEILDLIEREQPDVIVLQEIDEAWMRAISPLRHAYAHAVAGPRSDNFGMAVLSRIEPQRAEVVRIGHAGVPSIECVFEIDGRPLTILATHPVPPVSLRLIDLRDDQLRRMAERMRRTDGRKIIVGDLNVTMWSRPYRELIETTDLRNARRGFGVMPTWPANRPFFMHIPIDHVLVSDGIAVVDCRVGADVGSDHRPIVVDLALPAER